MWGGSGGQLSLGSAGMWGSGTPHTRLVITGIDPDERGRIERALADVVMTDFEATRVAEWIGREDGFAPWLGDGSERDAG
ncbi:hypothetical protein GCM10027418_22050 [Mariniluteicoccus endophyticus]